MIDLPILDAQPYPSKYPWYDVSQYLRKGLSPFAPGSVAASVDGNFVHYSFMVLVNRVDPDLSVHYLMNAIHPSLRVAANGSTTGWFSKPDGTDQSHRIEFGRVGWVAAIRFPSMGIKMADFHLVSLTMTGPRSKP
ncbi:hypothetical protein [Glutamicibacter sp. 2E12]|uniref:hypothetical protein n=1 Tax=Glutamicibacter sp. 2E12 TaxID=3416181 RepID=UPI003CFA8976